VETATILEELVAKVETFGGRIEDVGARGLVATFGFDPVEDAPSRAAHAAMAGRKVLERHAGRLSIRMAIHWAEFRTLRLGTTASIDLDDKRRACTLLDRLVLDTEPNTIRVTGALVPFLERRFQLAPDGDVAGVHVRQVVGHEGPRFTVRGHVTRYVGRRQERDMLHARLAQARAGRGQVVALVGDAGIGKSRLLFEFRQALGNASPAFVEGRCLSYARDTAYRRSGTSCAVCVATARRSAPRTSGAGSRGASPPWGSTSWRRFPSS
jgi:hypothetical protein